MSRLKLGLAVAWVAVAIGCTGGVDPNGPEGVMQRWLQGHQDGNFVEVVALTSDSAFSDLAKAGNMTIAQVREKMPKIMEQKFPEKLLRFEIRESRKVSDTEVEFVVSQRTLRDGAEADKVEYLYTVLENGSWVIDPMKSHN